MDQKITCSEISDVWSIDIQLEFVVLTEGVLKTLMWKLHNSSSPRYS